MQKVIAIVKFILVVLLGLFLLFFSLVPETSPVFSFLFVFYILYLTIKIDGGGVIEMRKQLQKILVLDSTQLETHDKEIFLYKNNDKLYVILVLKFCEPKLLMTKIKNVKLDFSQKLTNENLDRLYDLFKIDNYQLYIKYLFFKNKQKQSFLDFIEQGEFDRYEKSYDIVEKNNGVVIVPKVKKCELCIDEIGDVQFMEVVNEYI